MKDQLVPKITALTEAIKALSNQTATLTAKVDDIKQQQQQRQQQQQQQNQSEHDRRTNSGY